MPANATRWSTRAMAKRAGMSQSATSRIWRALGLKPRRVDTFKLSADPEFAEQVCDIVGLYLAPPERALVLCMDESWAAERTNQMQAVERTQPVLPMRPGQAERRTSDYARHGTSSLFAALEVAVDVAVARVTGRCYRRHRREQFRGFLDATGAAVRHPSSGCTWSWATPQRTSPRSCRTGR